MPKGVPRDPLLDNAAVRLYREIVHLQLNHVQRACVAEEVTNLRVWEAVLLEFMLSGRNPKDVLKMLRTYELQAHGIGRHGSNGSG